MAQGKRMKSARDGLDPWESLLWGVFLLLSGVGLLGWIAFNLFVERQEASEGLNPLPASVFAAALVGVGVMRIRSARRRRE